MDGNVYWSTVTSGSGGGAGSSGIFDGGDPNSVYTNEPKIDAGGVL
jgi:hypothetical protein